MSDESLKGMAEQNKRYEYRSDGIFRFAYAVDRVSRRNHGWSGWFIGRDTAHRKICDHRYCSD